MTINKTKFLFLMAAFNYIIFAYDIEYDRDILTWSWLAFSIIFFTMGIMSKYDTKYKK